MRIPMFVAALAFAATGAAWAADTNSQSDHNTLANAPAVEQNDATKAMNCPMKSDAKSNDFHYMSVMNGQKPGGMMKGRSMASTQDRTCH